MRFHTSRGMSSGLAPPTTACDASRGAQAAAAEPLPPPPTGGPVSSSIHAGPTQQFASMQSHPVYAPQGFGVDTGAPPAASGPPLGGPPPGAPPQARTSPFGQPPVASSPFGVVPGT